MAPDLFASRSLRAVTALWLLGLFAVLGGWSCSDDGKAEEDIDEALIVNHKAAVDVVVNADRFPNFAHTCFKAEHGVIGFWSTTDRVTIIVYNDHACAGSHIELPMTVLSGSPRDVINAGS